MVTVQSTGVMKCSWNNQTLIRRQKSNASKFTCNYLLFLFIVFFSFHSNLSARDQGTDFKELFRNVKIIRVVYEESYSKAKDYTLKNYHDVEDLLGDMGYSTVEEDATYYDATLRIKIRGVPHGASYSIKGRWGGKSYDLYTGASVKGKMYFKIAGVRSKVLKFSGKIKPSEEYLTYYDEPIERAENAPFNRAFMVSSGLSKLLRQIANLSPKKLTPILGSNDLEECKLAANVLAEMREPIANKILVVAMSQHGEHNAKIIAQALEKMGWQPTTDQEKATLFLAHGNFEAATALGKPAVEPLILVLKNILNWKKRSIRALGEIGDPRAVEPLLDALAKENLWDVVCPNIVEAFVKIGNPAAEKLVASLKSDDYYVRKGALEALKRIEWQPCTIEGKAIWLIMNRDCEAAAELGQPAVPAIVSMLEHSNYRVRRCAVEALGVIGDPLTTHQLTTLLKDKVESVRASAARALGKIGGREAEGPLIKALRDEDADVRKEAVQALIKIADNRSIKSLVKSLRYSALAGLVLIKIGKPAVEPLIDALKYEDYRANAAFVLGEIGDKRAANHLAKYLSDYDPKVRKEVAIALDKLRQKSN